MPKQTRETPLTGKTKSGKVLSEKEELFCNEYVQNLGNGTEAAMNSYGSDDKPLIRTVASSIAAENLRKPHILERIREVLDLGPLSNESVDAELNFLISQSTDMGSKKGGIEIYNKLKGRYEKDNKQKQPQVTINIEKREAIKKALGDV